MPVEGVHASPTPAFDRLATTPETPIHTMDKPNSSNVVDSLSVAMWKQAAISDKDPQFATRRRKPSLQTATTTLKDVDPRSKDLVSGDPVSAKNNDKPYVQTNEVANPPTTTKLKRQSAGKFNKTPSLPSKSSLSFMHAKPITAIELMTRLETERRETSKKETLLIDMRDINEFNNDTITGAINVNLPTLLIKRFRRNAMSTFKMENFVTSTEGKDYYAAKDKANVPIVVFDQCMDETDSDLHAWTLLAILEKLGVEDASKSDMDIMQDKSMYWLRGGYDVFKQFDVNHEYTTAPLSYMKSPSTQPQASKSVELDPTVERPSPVLSRSTTIPSSQAMNSASNLQRRASLFSLDTGAARVRRENSNRILRQASQRAANRAAANGLSHTDSFTTSPESLVNGSADVQKEDFDSASDIDSDRLNLSKHLPTRSKSSNTDGPDSAATNDSGFYTSSSTNSTSDPLQQFSLSSYDYDMDNVDDLTSMDSPPISCEETQFVVSEVVPGFLFVGPEITTPEHVQILREKSVKRILNMAEECDDDVPGVRECFNYQKIPARDTVDMRNVSSTFNTAVRFIEDAKRLHEPTYVHCRAGKSRSVTAILAYLILSEKWTLKRAYRHVTKARPNMSPNIGFVAELMKLEGRVHGIVSGIDASDPSQMPLPSPKLKQDLTKLKQEWENSV
ncbi:hypothetical protein INT43_006010 [Umbelopsis isabellina]|uniref:protein-tyrosine-phosphatase n=1 Tax=Mortierella isabellina TaxID=91625 RepID=A0A8H7PJ70_MORIS|nr:hypothetical protein INT43_006010 [Umbelopsis isabellina]